MTPNLHGRAYLAALREKLEVQIKLDAARAIRRHPHLPHERTEVVFQSVTGKSKMNRMICDLARQEVEKAITRGDVPPAAMIHLAGYRQNPIAEG